LHGIKKIKLLEVIMNNVVLIGRLTRDPEVRDIPESQSKVATFSIAIDRPGKDKGADFPRITCFGKTAELVERFIGKGRLVGIQGRIQTGSYKNKEGATVYTTDVVAERVEFLDRGDKAGTDTRSGFERQDAMGTPGVPEGFQALEDDDDIPF
jgi:single-strand DNA-binding protein